MRLICALVSALCILACMEPVSSYAENYTAIDITDTSIICADGVTDTRLTDNSIYTYKEVSVLEITSDEPVFGLYIKFDREPNEWTLISGGEERSEGEEGYLHQYIKLDGCKELTANFAKGTVIADIFLFGEGAIPGWVHVWETAEYADIMICPTHSDDDQLFFAGMLPWCAAKGYTVQIVYLTNHLNTHDRPHELLEGIWHCGIKYYPYISEFPDLYAENLEQAVANYKAYGYERNAFTEFYIEALQRFKPLVVAGHDIDGEYGHGVHMLSFHALTDAVEESASRGLWDVPKTYIHLWDKNRVTFNWDEPLDFFDGKTAFEVSQDGYSYHKSQHRFTGLSNWLYGTEYAPITKASLIRVNSPCDFGLYRSTVGLDSTENGLFENLVSYGEAAKAEKEQEMLKKAVAAIRQDAPIFQPNSGKQPTPTVLFEESGESSIYENSDSISEAETNKDKSDESPKVVFFIAVVFALTTLGLIVYRHRKGHSNVRDKKHQE